MSSTHSADLIVGTSRGVYLIDGQTQSAQHTLPAKLVRDICHWQNTTFVATGNGVYASQDGGLTFTSIGLDRQVVWQVTHDGTNLYASTQPAGIWRYAHGSWQANANFQAVAESSDWCIPVDPPQPAAARTLVFDQSAQKRCWAGVEVGGIAMSQNDGNSWQMTLPNDNPDIHVIVVHPQESETLFVSTGYGRLDGIAPMEEGNAGVFLSRDAGQTWDYVWKGVTPRYSRPMCISQQAPFAVTVAAAPTAFSHHKAKQGAQACLFQSTDFGQHWQNLGDSEHNPSTANFHGICAHPTDPSAVYVGTDTGEVWLVKDDCSWQNIATDLPTVLSIDPIA